MNTNLRITLTQPPGAVLLRLFQRGTPEARRDIALREAALDRLVHAHVPTARFLHVAPDNPVNGVPYAVLQWITGTRLDHAGHDTDATSGAAIGRTLAAIHAFRFPRAGFFTPVLDVPHPIDLDASALLRFMQQCLIDKGGSAQLGSALTERLFAFVRQHGYRTRRLARRSPTHPRRLQRHQHSSLKRLIASRRRPGLGVRAERQPGLRLRQSASPAARQPAGFRARP